MRRTASLIGQRFERLTVVGAGERPEKVACVCDCGTAKQVNKYSLLKGETKSCGCYSRDRSRACYNPKSPKFAFYGGRGIGICERWQVFANFLADMGERPAGMTLDRRDGNLGYTPDNCRWATKLEQANNTRANRHVIVDGVSLTVAELARRTNISSRTITYRLNHGLPYDLA